MGVEKTKKGQSRAVRGRQSRGMKKELDPDLTPEQRRAQREENEHISARTHMSGID